VTTAVTKCRRRFGQTDGDCSVYINGPRRGHTLRFPRIIVLVNRVGNPCTTSDRELVAIIMAETYRDVQRRENAYYATFSHVHSEMLHNNTICVYCNARRFACRSNRLRYAGIRHCRRVKVTRLGLAQSIVSELG